MKHRTDFRAIAWSIILLISLMLTACGTSVPTQEAPPTAGPEPTKVMRTPFVPSNDEPATAAPTPVAAPTVSRGDMEFTVTWIGFWFNIPGVTLDPTEVTNQFFDSGHDVVISGIDTTQGIVVAGQRADQGEQVYAVPYDYRGACGEAPDVCLGVPFFNWGPAYVDEVQAVVDGTWEQHWTWLPPDWRGDITNPETSNVGWVTGPAITSSDPRYDAYAPGEKRTCVEDDFVFGMILVGPKNDHGWSQAHYEAGIFVEEHIANTCMIVFESLNPADHPEATVESVATEMVAQGAQLIFTTSDEFEEDTANTAEAHSNVQFVNISGDDAWADGQDAGVAPDNLSNVMGRMEDMKAIAGCAAALASETGKIGYLGPLINFETRRLASSAYLGAKYCWENYPAGGDVEANLDDFITRLALGQVDVWRGPINLQDGTLYVEVGDDASDQQIWYLPQLLLGMTGPSE